MAGETAQSIVAVKHRTRPKERLPPISPCVAAATNIDVGDGFLALSSGWGRPFKMTAEEVRLAQAATGKTGTKVGELCAESGITRQPFYRYVDPIGALRPDGEKFLSRPRSKAPATVEINAEANCGKMLKSILENDSPITRAVAAFQNSRLSGDHMPAGFSTAWVASKAMIESRLEA